MAGRAELTTYVNRAEAAAQKALELGPESAEAHTAMAQVHQAMDRFEECRFGLVVTFELLPVAGAGRQRLR
jgi:hypothetical protein